METSLQRKPQTDPDLIQAVRSGSTDALAELYRRHADAVMRVAYRLTASRADAEDVTHDVFAGLPESLDRYEERGSFEQWLGRVAARVALSRRRQRGRRREVGVDELTGSERVIDLAERVALQRAIADLPNSLRAVFVLHAMEGYPHLEIAELLGISTTASQVRLSRAMVRLRQQLKGEATR